jgi:serine/threonine protein kinase
MSSAVDPKPQSPTSSGSKVPKPKAGKPVTKPRPYGHYFILEKIAQGGMAEIFKGLTYDFSGLKKFIVIKRILPHIASNEDFIRMLVDEAKIAVRLNHGNIAQTYDLGRVAEDYFIVMEFVEGKTVSQLYKKAVAVKQGIPIAMAVHIISEICNGLDYIHRREDELGNALGIVHCDISPQNVIVSHSGIAKIVDFGVAKAAFKLSEKDRGVLKGKFAYMSPEQTEGLHVEANSDIFSTGVVLWELLTGRRLFKKKVNSETIKAVQSMSVYPPSAYRNEIPSKLDEIVMKALERDPRKRYQSASDVSLDLTKFNLKHFPEFKPSQIGGFLQRIFEDEESTGDILQEKTHHEEITLVEDMEAGAEVRSSEETPVEETMIVDPQELDFHSIFEDIEVEEVSEVTRDIAFSEEEEDSPGPGMYPGSDEITRVLPEDHEEDFFPTGGVPGSSKSRPMRDFLWIFLGILAMFLIYYFIARGGFVEEVPDAVKTSSALLKINSRPEGVAIYLDGQPTGKVTPAALETENLRFPIVIGLSKAGAPMWKKEIPIAPPDNFEVYADLEIPYGTLDVRSSPTGATVSIEGKPLGKTPLYSAQVEAEKEIPLTIELKGYKIYKKSINLKPGQKEEIHQTLQKEASR